MTSVVVPIYKGKGDVMNCGAYRGVKLLEHGMKIVERVLEKRIRALVEVDDSEKSLDCMVYVPVHFVCATWSNICK